MTQDLFPQPWLANWDDFAELAHLLRSFKVMAAKRAEYLVLLN